MCVRVFVCVCVCVCVNLLPARRCAVCVVGLHVFLVYILYIYISFDFRVYDLFVCVAVWRASLVGSRVAAVVGFQISLVLSASSLSGRLPHTTPASPAPRSLARPRWRQLGAMTTTLILLATFFALFCSASLPRLSLPLSSLLSYDMCFFCLLLL